MLKNLKDDLQKVGTSKRAEISQRYFKTGKGQYGEGDIFLGITSGNIKKIVQNYLDLELFEIEELLKSPVHEHRSAGTLILVNKYKKSKEKKRFFDFYRKNLEGINNWDLVDMSAPHIVGGFLTNQDKKLLYELAKSENLWKKRIAIIATLNFIRNNQYKDTFRIAEILLNDKHDLIHKAVGWMLREVGKRNIDELRKFLKKHYKKMPRTMLRYAIERFDEEERQKWLRGEFK